jgi:hypothetical protein
MKTQIVGQRWECKPQDLWVGVFFKLDYPTFDSNWTHKVVHMWICFIPCFPLHLQVALDSRWYASWWTLKTRCDSETHLNVQERWFYALKAVWCLWMRPTARDRGGDDPLIAGIWNVFAGGEGHAWDEVRVGAGVFRNWWAEACHESE